MGWGCHGEALCNQANFLMPLVRLKGGVEEEARSSLTTGHSGKTVELQEEMLKVASQLMVLPWSLAWFISSRSLFSHSQIGTCGW